MRTPKVITICAMTALLVSCMGTAGHRPPPPIYNGPVSEDALMSRLAFSGLGGLRAEVKARLWQGGKSAGSFKGALVMRPPDDMRVVLYDTFGNTAIDIVRAGGRIEAMVPSEEALYVGEAPSMMPPEGSTLVLEEGEGEYDLYALEGGVAVRRYVFDARYALNTRTSVMPEGVPLMEAEFSDYLGTLPETITLSYRQDIVLELKLKEPELGAEVPARLFPLGRTAPNIYDIGSMGPVK